MTRVLRDPDTPPVARTALADDEEPTDALLRVARRAGIASKESDPRLYDQLEAGALDRLVAHQRRRSDAGECTIVTRLWERTFVVTESAVTVYP